jgi:hypothetical protein
VGVRILLSYLNLIISLFSMMYTYMSCHVGGPGLLFQIHPPDIEQWGQSSGANVIPRRARSGLAGLRPHTVSSFSGCHMNSGTPLLNFSGTSFTRTPPPP